MSNPTTNPLFYVDNLQQNGTEYTADLHLPENFNYSGSEVIGNSKLVPEILKIQLSVTGDKNVAPAPKSKTVPVSIKLDAQETGTYLKFKIVWLLTDSSEGDGDVGETDDRETVGESVLKGAG